MARAKTMILMATAMPKKDSMRVFVVRVPKPWMTCQVMTKIIKGAVKWSSMRVDAGKKPAHRSKEIPCRRR
jgi:hypothetical protein